MFERVGYRESSQYAVCELWSATLDHWREIFFWVKNKRNNDLWPNLANLLVVLFWYSAKAEIGTILRLLLFLEIGGVSLAFQCLMCPFEFLPLYSNIVCNFAEKNYLIPITEIF